ncbi:MAG: pentapeptide repeat-containing protein [Lentimicrobiaceae bacterium]|nr:pentapeptide repeat-containing protein [Lentimicrobiaceae bacterium]
MLKRNWIWALAAFMVLLPSCYEIEPYTPDPDKVYVAGQRIKPRTEKEFALNPGLRVQLGTVVAVHLEHFNSPAGTFLPDTDSNGIDMIRYNVEDSTTLIYRRGEDNTYQIQLYNDAMDSLYFSVMGPGDEVKVQLKPGKYVMRLISQLPHGIDSVGYQMVFIQPARDAIAKKGIAGEPKYWFLTSHVLSCVDCDLGGIDLQGTYLLGADFQKADLRGALLNGADLKTAKVMHAKLDRVQMSGADMQGVNLSFSVMRQANLTNARLNNSILNAVDLTGARAYGTNFCFATKNGWIIDGVLVDAATQCFP